MGDITSERTLRSPFIGGGAMKTALVLALSLLAAPASAETLSFNLDPPLSVFSGSLGVFASASYLETVADGSDCWWLFVGAYNADQPPIVDPAPYTPPIVWPPSGPSGPSATVPEAPTLLMVAAGLAGMAMMRRARG